MSCGKPYKEDQLKINEPAKYVLDGDALLHQISWLNCTDCYKICSVLGQSGYWQWHRFIYITYPL